MTLNTEYNSNQTDHTDQILDWTIEPEDYINSSKPYVSEYSNRNLNKIQRIKNQREEETKKLSKKFSHIWYSRYELFCYLMPTILEEEG